MFKKKDIHFAKKVKKLWDRFHFVYKGNGLHFLSKNKTLNIGTSIDKDKTYWKIQKRKKERRETKKLLKNYNKN